MQLHKDNYESTHSSDEDGGLGADDRHKIGWIEEIFEKGESGVYKLYTSKYEDYSPRYIGRFEEGEDIAEEILDFARGGKYSHFALEYKDSPEEAFKRLCGLWHYYREKLDNASHPRRLEGTAGDVSCPQCNDYQYELF